MSWLCALQLAIVLFISSHRSLVVPCCCFTHVLYFALAFNTGCMLHTPLHMCHMLYPLSFSRNIELHFRQIWNEGSWANKGPTLSEQVPSTGAHSEQTQPTQQQKTKQTHTMYTNCSGSQSGASSHSYGCVMERFCCTHIFILQ